MKNLKPTKVVAFDKKGLPVARRAEEWDATFNERKGVITLRSGPYKKQFTLDDDSLSITVLEEKGQVALGATLGRMALTGLATNGFAHGKGLAGAVMDLAVRGTEQNVLLRCELVLSNLTTVTFDATPAEIQKWPGLINAASDSARERLQKLQNVLRRFKLDGERVLPEVDAELERLAAKAAEVTTVINTAQNFNDRDRARATLLDLETEIYGRRAVREALLVDLAIASQSSTGRLARKIGGILGGLVFVVIAALAFMAWAVKTPANGIKPTPSVNTTLPEKSIPEPQSKPAPLTVTLPPTPAPTPPLSALPSTTTIASQEKISRPAFDCLKARPGVEKMICSDPALGEADQQLAGAYRNALSKSIQPAELRRDQNAWRTTERDQCQTTECVLSSYRTRIQALE